MNKVITTHVLYGGTPVSVEKLKPNSNIFVLVECSLGQREVRWNRRDQLCKQCAASAGRFNSSPKGRQITWGHKISKAKKGIKLSDKHKIALSISHYKCDEKEWPGFYSKSEIQKIRDSVEYMDFRKSMMQRDNFTCQVTGMRGKLEIHHLDGMDNNLEKSMDPTNVVTLHKSVHKTFHDIYGRGNNTRRQFEEFILAIKDDKYV